MEICPVVLFVIRLTNCQTNQQFNCNGNHHLNQSNCGCITLENTFLEIGKPNVKKMTMRKGLLEFLNLQETRRLRRSALGFDVWKTMCVFAYDISKCKWLLPLPMLQTSTWFNGNMPSSFLNNPAVDLSNKPISRTLHLSEELTITYFSQTVHVYLWKPNYLQLANPIFSWK